MGIEAVPIGRLTIVIYISVNLSPSKQNWRALDVCAGPREVHHVLDFQLGVIFIASKRGRRLPQELRTPGDQPNARVSCQ
jgi:hypothetical protein